MRQQNIDFSWVEMDHRLPHVGAARGRVIQSVDQDLYAVHKYRDGFIDQNADTGIFQRLLQKFDAIGFKRLPLPGKIVKEDIPELVIVIIMIPKNGKDAVRRPQFFQIFNTSWNSLLAIHDVPGHKNKMESLFSKPVEEI